MEKSPQAFRTISEVSQWLETPAHVLRFWESRFPEIAPVKRAGGRRYYRPEDMRLLGGIKHLLHSEGHTIKSVQDRLKSDGLDAVSAFSQPLSQDPGDGAAAGQKSPREKEHAASQAMLADVLEDPSPPRRSPTEEDGLPPIGFFFDDSEDAAPAKDQSGTFAPDAPEPRAIGAGAEAGDSALDTMLADAGEDGVAPIADTASDGADALADASGDAADATRAAMAAAAAAVPADPPDPTDPANGAIGMASLPMTWELRALDTFALDAAARSVLLQAAETLGALRDRQDDAPRG